MVNQKGTSPAEKATERNKMIAATILGVLALVSLYFAFGKGLFSSPSPQATTAAKASPQGTTPAGNTPAGTAPVGSNDLTILSEQEQAGIMTSTPVVYHPGIFSAPDAGRNIFAFYEPPPPCVNCPTPTPPPTPPPTPAPTPPVFIAYVSPQNIYAGSPGFRLEVTGDKFTPEMRIFFDLSELPTKYVSAQKVVADIPSSLIAREGPRQIIVRTPRGELFSNQVLLTVQSPPKPQFQYVGMIARKYANNDTAVFREQGKQTEFSARLNDVVGGRFRLMSISSDKVILEDINLGFRHPLDLFRPAPGSLPPTVQESFSFPGNRRGRRGFPVGGGAVQEDIQGIPGDIPRYVPPSNPNTNVVPSPTPGNRKREPGEDDGDEDDGDGDDTDGKN